jgi:zinc transport system substrate-binding protein
MTYRVFASISVFSLLVVSTLAMAQEKLSVYAVNYPLQYFAQRVAGEQVDVILPVPAGVDPAFWQPDADTVNAYQQADLVLLNGAGYAKWVSRVSLPRRKLVDTSAAFRERYIHADAGVTHSHGREGDHSHSGVAFTTWLDFTLAVEQARAIAAALSKIRPASKNIFERNLALLEQELLALDSQVREMVATKPGISLLASHPVYQYFKRRYGLNIASVMWEPDVVPGAVQWSELKQLLKLLPSNWMVWEGRPDPESVARLESMGVGSLVFDPCGNRPVDGDFLGVMQQNLQNLKRAY